MASKTKEIKALERLTSKLSALRKTLRGDERKALDAMVLSASSEVSAHAVKVSPAKATGKTLAVSEVATHAAKVMPAKTTGKTLAVSEVATHAAAVRGANTDAKALAITSSKTARVVLDAKAGIYGVVVD